jgi:hypothetical protein
MEHSTKLRNRKTGQVVEIQYYKTDYFAYPPEVWEIVPNDTPVTPIETPQQ